VTELAEPFRPETLVGIEAVQRALTIARPGVDAEDVSEKGERDLVTVADVAVEDAVRHVLTNAMKASVIGEERGGEVPADGSPYWLVDPICGTRNFASGIPLYCVNLALVEGNEVTVAVVGDPSRGEIDVAERRRGAWRLKDGSRHRLTTSDESRTLVIEEGKSQGSRREQAAAGHRGGHPGRSIGRPFARDNVGVAVPGCGPYCRVRGLLGLSRPHWGREPVGYRSRRHRVGHRWPPLDHPLRLVPWQRQSSSPRRVAWPCARRVCGWRMIATPDART
jgi:hypothetical protein